MKIRYLFAIYIHFHIIQKAQGSFYDPICYSGNGEPMRSKLLPHTHDCTKYIQCSNGIAYMQKCPQNLHWNRRVQICDYPSSAKCQQHIAAAATPNFKCLSGYYYRHEENCSKFYYCKYGIKVPLSCVPGFHWDQQQKRCDTPQVANCPYATDTIYKELIQNGDKYAGCPLNDISWLSSTYLPYPGDCTRFLKCSYGRAWIIKCPMGLQWSVLKNRCDYAIYVKCQYNVEKEKDIDKNKYSEESSNVNGGSNGEIIKTTPLQITLILPFNLTTQENTIDNAITTDQGFTETSTAKLQPNYTTETTIMETVKNKNNVIYISTTITVENYETSAEKNTEIVETTSSFTNTSNDDINTTIERITEIVDSAVKDVETVTAFEGTSNTNVENIETTSETVGTSNTEFVTNDVDSTRQNIESTTETTVKNTVINLLETTIPYNGITTKVVETICEIVNSSNDKTNTITKNLSSTTDNTFEITPETKTEDTTNNPSERSTQTIEVTSEIADKTTVESTTQLTLGIADLTNEIEEVLTEDSTTMLYENSGEMTEKIVDTTIENEITNFYEIIMQSEESTTKVIETNCEISGAANDETNTTSENVGSLKDIIFEVTTETTVKDTTKNLSKVTSEIADTKTSTVNIIESTAETTVESAAQVATNEFEKVLIEDSTTILYESSTQITTEIVCSNINDIELTSDGSSMRVTTEFVDTITNNGIEATTDVSTEHIETTKEIVDLTIADVTSINDANTATEIIIETATKFINDYIIDSANDDTDNTNKTKPENTHSDITRITPTSKNNEITNDVNTTITSVQTTGRVGNAAIQTNANSIQLTKPGTTTAQSLTTQDPRLPFRAPQCSGINNRVKFVAMNCQQFYQCFEGYAYLLNCYDGYAFSVTNSKCIQADDTTCKENMLEKNR